ncbi:hypothetical protein CapIbe_011216 [Capra ibex]
MSSYLLPSIASHRNPLSDVGLASPQAGRTGKDWTLASGKGVRKDGCLYPSDQQGQWSLEERWSVADGARCRLGPSWKRNSSERKARVPEKDERWRRAATSSSHFVCPSRRPQDGRNPPGSGRSWRIFRF